jgi:hypothetical protein
MRLLPFAAGIAALCLSAPAAAEDTKPCGAGLICASDPQTVMAALEKAGLKPRLSKDGEGDPMIESDESSYHFDVYFYGCAEHKNCDSLRFETLFEKALENTPALADKWNSKKRFLQASVRNDQQFAVAYDLATIGGLNAANFTDVIDWWNSQLNELATFFKEEIPEKKAEPKS